ncbi:MAG: HlyD family efflux transporter periplasmic adaptor subunit [Ramlibacter sp.]|nr:HlyD family efflux transporter periplasmic adaptor subunit [Ramlibacter sp.]
MTRWPPMLLPLLVLAACGPAPDAGVMSGYVEADLVYVASGTGGTLRSVAVHRGDPVAQGQLLYTLDDDAETLATQAAQARSEGALAQERDLLKGRRPVELEALDQQLARARATLSASTAALQRNQRLVKDGFIAAIRLEELVASRDRDAARVRELQAQRELAAKAARTDQIAAAAAAARASRADEAQAAWRAGQRSRSAPAAAQVFDVMFRAGEWVNPGVPVVALLPPDALKVRFFVPEGSLPRAAPGQQVTVSCDGCERAFQARVRWVSPQAEFTPPVIYSNASRSKLVFMVEAVPLAASALRPGQPVEVRFSGAARE